MLLMKSLRNQQLVPGEAANAPAGAGDVCATAEDTRNELARKKGADKSILAGLLIMMSSSKHVKALTRITTCPDVNDTPNICTLYLCIMVIVSTSTATTTATTLQRNIATMTKTTTSTTMI